MSKTKEHKDDPQEVMLRKPSEWTHNIILQTFCDFLTVAIHTILFIRDLYPPELFERARKYNTVVRRSRHPMLNDWIRDVVTSVNEELKKCTVNRVSVIILSADETPMERFVFDVSSFPNIPEQEHNIPISSTSATFTQSDLLEQFRATLIRIQQSATTLGKLPEDCTFTVAIELKEHEDKPAQYPDPWIPAQPQQNGVQVNGESVRTRVTTKPLRNIEIGPIKIDAWIEESRAKGKLKEGERA
ncbi:hypothetical protein G7K_3641-t1 [Saitoella complicata NRRL Y-17804]|uniref:HORMA domain-containing protein n=1 Tax=Saitoella complicata (strain BCRC 22490 / CBS 7301 / JCM 7358 / NBRC 10748 / NRRL Y-17804) TaxID=698492 RepID=A0A0E9NI00_SAICN|nr:hypothetical protein G7K_3641-t1 [Saitoella complicata NRRL Y-17804]